MVSGDKPGCITERRTADGYYWRYTHSQGEPQEMLTMAFRIAVEIAAAEARNYSKGYVVAFTPRPVPAVYVLAHDHPALAAVAMTVMYALTPEGQCIHHKITLH
jgi:hypothetical protein